MLKPAPAAMDRAQGFFQRVLESLALLTLLIAVSLYLVGRIYSSRFFGSFGLSDINTNLTWDAYVFRGFAAVSNTLSHVENPALRAWILPGCLALLAGLGARRAFLTLRRPWLRWPAVLVLGYFTLVLYFATLIRLGGPWGLEEAQLLKGTVRTRHHFVFQDSARSAFPEGLFKDNDANSLKVIEETPEFSLLLSADGKRVYRVRAREIRLHETQLPEQP